MKQNILLIDGENFLHKIEEVFQRESKAKGLTEAIDLNFNQLFDNPLKGINIDRKIFYGANRTILLRNSEILDASTSIKGERI